jgi:hypothetical protein
MGVRGDVAAALKTRATASELATAPAAEAPAAWRWGWARHWELWLALVVGAFLRLWRLDLSTFLIDQNISMRLARIATVGHLIPVTSVEYSVGGYAPPFGLDLVLPFAAITRDPFPVIVSIALWNILGVALCYSFALKYYGRWVAGVGTLLFATCGVAVNYSRFIWQPNYEATFLVLWALALFAWCIGGRRGFFAVSAILLLLLIEITPVAVLLIPITAVAWLLASVRPGRREYAALGVVALIILSPTLLWETITHGLDFSLLLHPTGGQPATINLAVLHVLYATIGSHGASGLGPNSLYDQFDKAFTVVNLLALLFLAAGYAILTLRVLAPAVRVWREGAATSGAGADDTTGTTSRIAAWWATLRADRRWCVELLLWLWVTLPPLSMLRHSSPPTVHYLLLAYPALFLVAAYPIVWLVEADGPWRLGRLARLPQRAHSATRAVSFLGVGLAALLIVAQAAQSTLGTASLGSPGFEAYQFYGIPLSSMQAAEQQISVLQQREQASAIFFNLPTNDRYRLGMDYLLVGERGDRASSTDTCLVLPAPSAAPSLVVTTTPGSPAAKLLPQLPNAQHIGDVPILGGEPFHVYRVSGAVPPLAGDVTVPPAVYRPAANDTLQLDAAAVDASGSLRLRWTVLSAPTSTASPEVYSIRARSPSQGTPTIVGGVNCEPTRWQAGETVYSWLPLGAANTALPAAVSLTLSASAPAYYEPQVGPLRLFSARVIDGTLALVPATGAPARSGTSGVARDDGYFLDLAGLA